jgi:hypothetical protein
MAAEVERLRAHITELEAARDAGPRAGPEDTPSILEETQSTQPSSDDDEASLTVAFQLLIWHTGGQGFKRGLAKTLAGSKDVRSLDLIELAKHLQALGEDLKRLERGSGRAAR